jgi:hypothetical protein
MANTSLQGEDTCIILSHGLIESQGTGRLKANQSHEFNTVDAVDSHPVVNRLAAAMAWEKETLPFFYADSESISFFGIKPMKDWIDSQEFKTLLLQGRKNLMFKEKEELWYAGKESSCIPLVHQWIIWKYQKYS